MKKKRIQKPIREYTDYQREYRRMYRTLNNGAPIYDSSDYVPCKICFKLYIRVCTHVVQIHKMTTAEYKKKFRLEKKSLVAGKFKQFGKEWTKGIGKTYGFAKSTKYAKAMSQKAIIARKLAREARNKAKLTIAK